MYSNTFDGGWDGMISAMTDTNKLREIIKSEYDILCTKSKLDGTTSVSHKIKKEYLKQVATKTDTPVDYNDLAINADQSNRTSVSDKIKKESPKQVATKTDTPVAYNVLAINADQSNRHKDINTQDTLATYVDGVVSGQKADVFVISEVAKNFSSKWLRPKLPERYSMTSHVLATDSLIVGWDRTVFEAHGDVTKENVDHVIICGDFNTSPKELEEYFNELGLKLCFKGNDQSTANDTCPDNVLISDSLSPLKKNIASEKSRDEEDNDNSSSYIFRIGVIRRQLFQEIETIVWIHEKARAMLANYPNKRLYIKGRDLKCLGLQQLIGNYAMPWNYFKDYLPPTILGTADQKSRRSMINMYCAHPNATLNTLNRLLEWSPDFEVERHVFTWAAMAGNLDIVQTLHNRFADTIQVNTSAIDSASSKGRLNVVKWLHLNRTEGATINAMNNAASQGFLDIVSFLHFNRSEGCNILAMDQAAENGHFDIIKFLKEHRSEGCSRKGYENAIKNNHIEIVRFLQEHYPNQTTQLEDNGSVVNVYSGSFSNSIDWAASHGHFEMLELLHNRGDKATKVAMDLAASKGHLKIVKYLHTHRTEGCTTNAMDNSSKNGFMECVLWLHGNRTEGCTTNALDNAAYHGHMNIVVFLNENRSEGTRCIGIDEAAGRGNMDLVKYLELNRTDGHRAAKANAAKGGHLEILQFLYQRSPPTFMPKRGLVDIASEFGHLHIVEWLLTSTQEQPSYLAMDKAAANNHLDIVKYLHHNTSVACTTLAMEEASANGHLEVVQFLNEYRTERCSFYGLSKAARNGHVEICRYLSEKIKGGPPIPITSLAMDQAAENGHLNVCLYLHENRTDTRCSIAALDMAIANGHLKVAHFLYHNRVECNPNLKVPTIIVQPKTTEEKYKSKGFLFSKLFK
ncbi:ankyrin repeat-containing protein [Cavenderia fasciculata]|uniref:Ankyrin repeat-containing protein n=1 Tax=Cavenderia fasciculata TaxID=261658 RepID=F4PKN5_CACFS|nr:ankyrin repeat-containing protein [Cavenderia fasciculata]EGG24159.1 ankyrin repeat-containing protein [Cavenderia fasciculata]|eukprot:XP_004362010.1 ankyrin repeat-containing protein [Cavenderia fasciculata]